MIDFIKFNHNVYLNLGNERQTVLLCFIEFRLNALSAVNINEIAQWFNRAPSTVRGYLSKLKKAGYLTHDSKGFYSLTPLGRALFNPPAQLPAPKGCLSIGAIIQALKLTPTPRQSSAPTVQNPAPAAQLPAPAAESPASCLYIYKKKKEDMEESEEPHRGWIPPTQSKHEDIWEHTVKVQFETRLGKAAYETYIWAMRLVKVEDDTAYVVHYPQWQSFVAQSFGKALARDVLRYMQLSRLVILAKDCPPVEVTA